MKVTLYVKKNTYKAVKILVVARTATARVCGLEAKRPKTLKITFTTDFPGAHRLHQHIPRKRVECGEIPDWILYTHLIIPARRLETFP